MDLRLALMCGTDIPVIECQLILHQPTIKEIALMGEKEFFQAVQTLSVNKNMISQDETLLRNSNNFQIFMMIMKEKQGWEKKQAVQTLLSLIFPKYKIMFTPRAIVFTLEGGQILVDESNFEYLQEIIKLVFCSKSGPMDQQTFNPVDAKAREIAEKLMRGRQRVAEERGEMQSSIFSQYISTLTVGLHSMSLQDCMDLTVYQLFDLVERYTLYINWDIDIRSRLAGAKPDSKPDNWMKNIH